MLQDKGEMVMRAYTPTSSDDDLGHFDLVVKIYFANQNPNFPMVNLLCPPCMAIQPVCPFPLSEERMFSDIACCSGVGPRGMKSSQSCGAL